MLKCITVLLGVIFSSSLFAQAIINADVLRSVNKKTLSSENSEKLPLIMFLKTFTSKEQFLHNISKIPNIQIQDLKFMPAVAVIIPKHMRWVNFLAEENAVAQIALHHGSVEELDITAQAIKLSPSTFYPEINNWWAHGYTGKKGVVGVIDSGIDPEHPGLANKNLILRKDDTSRNGVRSAHATGVACIYASESESYKGMAYGAKTFISAYSGKETADSKEILTSLNNLEWMLTEVDVEPTVINYSIGNGPLKCDGCTDWSGLAKVIDYVVNQKKILWVKSAGNSGVPKDKTSSTLTVPGDNYNALTVANMNTIQSSGEASYKTPNRDQHIIRNTSSRGPTPFGRKKPDLTAPGHDTRTCAPDPLNYSFQYTKAMDYKDGYRLMGGTSSAAPHVGAAALLLQDAGITNPMAVKALLINSADTWTDNNTYEPVAHHEVMGSEWNKTYGWGYLNMEKAFEQRNFIIEEALTLENPLLEYSATLSVGEKITLVHERRVGFNKEGLEWQLSHLALEVVNKETQEIMALDDSAKDSVHQVSNCTHIVGEKTCSSENKSLQVLARVKLLSKIDGSTKEPFALILNSDK